MVLLFMN
jgi:hypothetical protein